MEPWLSWGIALVVGGLAFYYYNSQKTPQASRLRAASTSDSAQPAAKSARKREDVRKPKPSSGLSSGVDVPRVNVAANNDTVGSSIAESGPKRKAAKKQHNAPSPSTQSARVPSAQPDDVDQADGDDTKAWAQGLQALKKGTTLAPPVRTDSRNRTVKQSAANLAPTFSSTSSSAADADDDLTPARSPALAAGDVSDMLEPRSNGPSVLRLTESSKPARAKQQRQPTPTETAETKKQRQNKKKVEERKLQREAEEKERLVLLENQRRTARESRGEPARNGAASSKPPAASEWAVRAAARATQPPAEVIADSRGDAGGLLDTFSEEAQMTMAKKLSEDESGWNTVPKGKKQKKRTQPSDVIDSNSSESAPSGSSEQATALAAATAAAAPPATSVPKAAPVPKSTDTNTNGYNSIYSSGYDTGSHPEDSQWSA